MFFDQSGRESVTLSDQQKADWLGRIGKFNQSIDGYGFDINFRAPNQIESAVGNSLYSTVRVAVKQNGFFERIYQPSTLGEYDPTTNTIRVEQRADQHVLLHEVGHKIGIDHSYSSMSLMAEHYSRENKSVTRFSKDELKYIVDQFRKW